MVLAGLIVAGAIVYVFTRRRKPSSAGLTLLPLLLTILAAGCIRNPTVPLDQRMLKSYPFTKQQALEKLETMSRSIQSLRASIDLTGSTASLKEDFKRPTANLSGAVLIERPNRILLKGGITPISIFEMVSDGTKYQFYSTRTGELYTEGLEDGPPYKRFDHLGDLANQFVNLRPKQIEQALVLDVLALLNNPAIRISAVENPVIQDQRKYFCIDFIEVADSREARLIQRIWFDLSTETIDVSRRQTWKRTGELETDTKYSEYQSVPAGIRFPGKVQIQFAATDTLIEIGLNPKDAVFNAGIPPDTFKFNNHPDAKIFKFVPADTQSITQQR
jgi:outer membrane lipoprotein-sorting protein